MAEFHETRMGRKFYEADVPRIAEALEDIGRELKRQNDISEAQPKPDVDIKDIAAEFLTDS